MAKADDCKSSFSEFDSHQSLQRKEKRLSNRVEVKVIIDAPRGAQFKPDEPEEITKSLGELILRWAQIKGFQISNRQLPPLEKD